MQSVDPFMSSALGVFQTTASLNAPDRSAPQTQPETSGIVPGINAAATGSAAASSLAENFFSVNYVDANEIKMQLFERLGGELGLDMNDYDDLSNYARDLRHAVQGLLREDGGEDLLNEIEQDLGLDKLGVSIDDVINAIDNPDGAADDKLTEAIKAEYKIDLNKDREAKELTEKTLQVDDLGLYSIRS